jgi:hypothetical protein
MSSASSRVRREAGVYQNPYAMWAFADADRKSFGSGLT